jgi:ribonuclease P protein component
MAEWRETLKRNEILRRQRDVVRVLRTGTRLSAPALSLRYAPRPGPEPATPDNPTANEPARRVAFLLPRGIRRAVDRNLLKRRLREVYRRNKDWFPAGYDYLLMPAASAAGLELPELRKQAETLCRRLPHGNPA